MVGAAMSRSHVAIGFVAAVLAAGEASAKPKPQPATSAARSARSSHTTGSARSSSNNMPRGFSWPPSQAMTDAEAACEHDLDAAKVTWRPAKREGHIADAVTIEDGTLGGIVYAPIYGKGPYKLDCQLALALHAIGPELYAAGVREVHFGSIYRWSNVRAFGKTKNVLSRHALGLAMDVVSFVDDRGRQANVAKDYPKGDSLLLEVEKMIDASSSFRLVLTPKNDPISHKDHFHIEANPSYATAVPRS